MSTSLLTRASDGAVGAGHRLRELWFTLIQTSVASGLAWYLANDVLHHRSPFFAPISAAVCLSISNVLRAQRAVQMMFGVTLGIGLGILVVAALGTGPVQIGVAVLISVCIAVAIASSFIGQGMMFANQMVVSSILMLALYRTGVGYERFVDALIGGFLAIVFAVLLFPADPLRVLSRARLAVLDVVHAVLCRTADFAAGRKEIPSQWPLSAVDRVHEQLGGLIQARSTARQVVRISPRRWRLRDTVQGADHHAVHVALLAGSVLQLARRVAPALGGCNWLPQPVHPVLTELVAATALADSNPAAASEHAAEANRLAATLHSVARERREVVLADDVQACIDDLQRVIDLRHSRPGSG
ncbi:MAG: FUSC family protein [Mycobacterium sp.]